MAESWHDRICGPGCNQAYYHESGHRACAIDSLICRPGSCCRMQPIAMAARAPLLRELKELHAEINRLRYEIEVLREDDE